MSKHLTPEERERAESLWYSLNEVGPYDTSDDNIKKIAISIAEAEERGRQQGVGNAFMSSKADRDTVWLKGWEDAVEACVKMAREYSPKRYMDYVSAIAALKPEPKKEKP
jgi:hypothetical protein